MEKNVIWAVILSAVFLLGWYHFFPPVKPPPVSQPASKETTSRSPSESREDSRQIFSPDSQNQPGQKTAPIVSFDKTIEVFDTEVVIHSRGASIKHWWLLDKNERVNLVNHPNEKEADQLLPFDQLPLATFSQLNFREVRTHQDSRWGAETVWGATLPSGIQVEKKYRWAKPGNKSSNGSYFMNMTVSFKNPTGNSIEIKGFSIGWDRGLGTVESEVKENLRVTRALAYPSPKKEVEEFKSGQYPASYQWVGMDNRYYLVAMLPDQGQFDHILVDKPKKEPSMVKLASKSFVMSPDESRSYELRIYAGPKGYTQLKKWDLGLEHAVDFGFFGFLGKGALKVMYALYGITGNYGWSIILLTCGIQVIVFPLSVKSYRSTAAMKKLQPKIQEMQKKYKDDSKRLNQEMLSLYRESKTNPFGGCLPMILQIPIFWAFFTMLRNSYELRGAPWIFWINDLSQKDPFFVLPIVMGGGMLLQQKISGTVGDPTQAKIMMFMPLIFTFMFLNFPSGLVLYWLTNSILSITTQYWCTKRFVK